MRNSHYSQVRCDKFPATREAIKAAARILSRRRSALLFHDLQLLSSQVRTYAGPGGAVMIGGATNAGKTTLMNQILYGALTSPAWDGSQELRLAYIEDISNNEFSDNLQKIVNPVRLNNETDNFERLVHRALHIKPDIISVPELRDPETVKAVMTASLTGHMVISTTHINGIPQNFFKHATSELERRNVVEGTAVVIICSLKTKLPVEILFLNNSIRDKIIESSGNVPEMSKLISRLTDKLDHVEPADVKGVAREMVSAACHADRRGMPENSVKFIERLETALHRHKWQTNTERLELVSRAFGYRSWHAVP